MYFFYIIGLLLLMTAMPHAPQNINSKDIKKIFKTIKKLGGIDRALMVVTMTVIFIIIIAYYCILLSVHGM